MSGVGAPSLPPPLPRSPPQRRREFTNVQVLEGEVVFLQDELKFHKELQPASLSCKEVSDFVLAKSDPLIPTSKKSSRSSRFWKWLCARPCSNISSIFCCRCSNNKPPQCCEHCDCSLCSSCSSCMSYSVPKCHTCCSFPDSHCSCDCCCCPSCLNCSRCCRCKCCCCPSFPKVSCYNCTKTCNNSCC